MRRFIYFAVVVLLLSTIVFSGCQGEKPSPTAASAPTSSTPSATQAVSQGSTLELRFATFIPPTDVYSVVMEEWAKELEQRTDGRVKVSFFHAQSLVKMPEMLDAVNAGTADMAFLNAGVYPDRLPVSQIMGLPLMIFSKSSQAAQAWWTLYNKYPEHQDEYTKAGVKVLWFNMPGPNQLEGKKVIKTMDDLKGLKAAVDTREELEACKLFGAVPVITPGGDKYISLERNVVDTSTQNYNGSKTWKTYQVTSSITENVDISYRICPTIISLETYNSMPEDIKKIFDEVSNGETWTKRAGQAYDESDAKCRSEIEEYHKAQGNPGIYRLPDDEKARWRETTQPINEAWVSGVEAKGLPGKAMLADVQALAEQYK